MNRGWVASMGLILAGCTVAALVGPATQPSSGSPLSATTRFSMGELAPGPCEPGGASSAEVEHGTMTTHCGLDGGPVAQAWLAPAGARDGTGGGSRRVRTVFAEVGTPGTERAFHYSGFHPRFGHLYTEPTTVPRGVYVTVTGPDEATVVRILSPADFGAAWGEVTPVPEVPEELVELALQEPSREQALMGWGYLKPGRAPAIFAPSLPVFLPRITAVASRALEALVDGGVEARLEAMAPFLASQRFASMLEVDTLPPVPPSAREGWSIIAAAARGVEVPARVPPGPQEVLAAAISRGKGWDELSADERRARLREVVDLHLDAGRPLVTWVTAWTMARQLVPTYRDLAEEAREKDLPFTALALDGLAARVGARPGDVARFERHAAALVSGLVPPVLATPGDVAAAQVYRALGEADPATELPAIAAMFRVWTGPLEMHAVTSGVAAAWWPRFLRRLPPEGMARWSLGPPPWQVAGQGVAPSPAELAAHGRELDVQRAAISAAIEAQHARLIDEPMPVFIGVECPDAGFVCRKQQRTTPIPDDGGVRAEVAATVAALESVRRTVDARREEVAARLGSAGAVLEPMPPVAAVARGEGVALVAPWGVEEGVVSHGGALAATDGGRPATDPAARLLTRWVLERTCHNVEAMLEHRPLDGHLERAVGRWLFCAPSGEGAAMPDLAGLERELWLITSPVPDAPRVTSPRRAP